jgi:hypothetical protein
MLNDSTSAPQGSSRGEAISYFVRTRRSTKSGFRETRVRPGALIALRVTPVPRPGRAPAFPRTLCPLASGVPPSLRTGFSRRSRTPCRTIELPAALHSDGVRDHPGMPFGFAGISSGRSPVIGPFGRGFSSMRFRSDMVSFEERRRRAPFVIPMVASAECRLRFVRQQLFQRDVDPPNSTFPRSRFRVLGQSLPGGRSDTQARSRGEGPSRDGWLRLARMEAVRTGGPSRQRTFRPACGLGLRLRNA